MRLNHQQVTISLFEALLTAELLGECCIATSAAEWFNGGVSGEPLVDGLRSRGGNNLGKGLLKEVAQHHATGMVEATGHHATVDKHAHLIAQGIAEHAAVVVATLLAFGIGPLKHTVVLDIYVLCHFPAIVALGPWLRSIVGHELQHLAIGAVESALIP